MGNFSRKRCRLRSARCGQLQRTLIISSFSAYNTGKKDLDLGSTLWASVENFDRMPLEFTGCRVSGSRTLLGRRLSSKKMFCFQKEKTNCGGDVYKKLFSQE